MADSFVDWVSGACFLARRQAFDELGGFDEAYFMYAEDIDLCWRAKQAGWKVNYVPGAVVTHLQGASTDLHPYRMLVAHHRSAYRFASRTVHGWRRATLARRWPPCSSCAWPWPSAARQRGGCAGPPAEPTRVSARSWPGAIQVDG